MIGTKTNYKIGDTLRATFGNISYVGNVLSVYETFDGDHSYLIEYAPMRHTYVNNWNYTLRLVNVAMWHNSLYLRTSHHILAQTENKMRIAYWTEYRLQMIEILDAMRDLGWDKFSASDRQRAEYDRQYGVVADVFDAMLAGSLVGIFA